MSISVGDKLPLTTFLKATDFNVEQVEGATLFPGRNVVLFALPGAFTKTCDSAHVPSFIRVAKQMRAKGVDDIICVATNDPFVMEAWSKTTGGATAGITFLSDPESKFTQAMGMIFDAPAVGFHRRSSRYALYAQDGVVKVLHAETQPGTCDLSGGESMLAAI